MGAMECDDESLDVEALLNAKYRKEVGCNGGMESKSELDKYLEASNGKFEILRWWRDNQKRYPILATMAHDVLVIPFSTIASESAFSACDHILDSFHTSLTPRSVEALICAQDWLRNSHACVNTVEECFINLENLEEGSISFSFIVGLLLFKWCTIIHLKNVN